MEDLEDSESLTLAFGLLGWPSNKMGVDYNAVKLLLWGKKIGVSFERALTLGHQGFDCSPRRLRQAVRDFGLPGDRQAIDQCFERIPMQGLYADGLLRFLGAREIVSVDKSDFEGATLLHDLNERFPESYRGRFTFVFDGGTLEHIFNYPAALRNCLELLANGGHFLTIVPAHSMMGHGFYQISPELFFRVFSAENGFALRQIVLYAAAKTDAAFFEVNDPAITGQRSGLVSKWPLLLGALAQRTAGVPILARSPQQSDYASAWERRRGAPACPAEANAGLPWRIRTALNPYWPYWLRRWKQRLFYKFRERGGSSSLSNRAHFRRLSREEMFHGQDAAPPA